jgi:DNA-binding PadR family transcriptional regulator
MTVPMAMLALLDSGPTHGFDLKRRYDCLLGHERELKTGQVYSTLARLERDGLASGVGVASGGGPERRLYAITAAGVTELDDWLTRPDAATGRPAEVFTRVILALASGRSAEAVLDAHRGAYLSRMRALTSARNDGDVIDRLAGDYEMAHLEADLKWIELAGSRLTATAAFITKGVAR